MEDILSLEPKVPKWQIPKELRCPVSPEVVLRKREALRKELVKQPNLLPTRIAVLGGSTTVEVTSMLELFLLAQGIQPLFYESAYNAYYEEVLFENPKLWSFRPDIVFVHTTWHNVTRFPGLLESEADIDKLAHSEMDRFEVFWDKISTWLGALIIQNNFDLPRLRPLGNLEASAGFARVNFLQRLNAEFARYASNHSRFLINDILYLSAQVGLAEWFDYNYWYHYHMAVSSLAALAVGQNVASIVKSVYGKTKKCLVLDLDNTLWGGVIGDDGPQNLVLGRDHPAGEAFTNFQQYVRDLGKRGILLAVCSKNDEENAKEGFSHPDTVLKLADFSAFEANWNPKPANICKIAAKLNIGLESMVFVDDNSAERAIVLAQLPEVAVPDVGSDVSLFAEVLERESYFDLVKLVPDDLKRAAYYSTNAARSNYHATFQSYDDFLIALEMTAQIGPFLPVYLERITQLVNKTNQFNLTTRRYTSAEVEAVSHDPGYITLYGRLCDKYGDNGLVSVIIGSVHGETLEIDVWLMSCRVLKRGMEYAMFDALVEQCLARGIRRIVGVYVPSKKNAMVSDHYRTLGFSRISGGPADPVVWHYDVHPTYSPKRKHIQRTVGVSESGVNEPKNVQGEVEFGRPTATHTECLPGCFR